MSFRKTTLSLSVTLAMCSASGAYGADLIAVPGLPEDIVDVKNSPWLVVSVMSPAGDGLEGLYALSTDSDSAVRLPVKLGRNHGERFPSCPEAPAKLSPHGLAIRESNGSLELLSVNHGSREAIEVFSLDISEGISARWIGCVPLPDDVFANGVTSLPDDGIAVTSIFDRSKPGAESEMLQGKVSGRIVAWTLESGWESQIGTEIPGANGLLATENGEPLFAASWTGKQLYRFAAAGSSWQPTSVSLPFLPDNLRWHGDTILVSGQHSRPEDVVRCASTGEGCTDSLSIVAVDPDTLDTTTIFEFTGEGLGEATVAVKKQGSYYVGNLRHKAVIRLPGD